ncbi:VOC family protein [bacterium]|nr:VOC family protein [bacterium]MCI0601439.1 VOC family protein [bacterium]
MFQTVSYIMINVSEMTRSIRFYRDQLGIPLRFESPGWTEFETGSTTLALHLGEAIADPSGRAAGSCTIGFEVQNLDMVYEELKEKGIRFSMPPKNQENEGIRLAVCQDPDGLSISFAELLKK